MLTRVPLPIAPTRVDASDSSTPQRLPDSPVPVQVEIEFTGSCNARCTACPRHDMPKTGLMSDATLERVVELYRDPDPQTGTRRPEIIVAGGGEPMLHPRATAFLSRLVEAGFAVSLTTNASKVTPERAAELASIGLEGIYVSFWGIEAAEYERAMRLPYERTLERTLNLARVAARAKVPLWVKWLQVPELSSTNEQIETFWHERGVATVAGYHDVWNRAGQLSIERGRFAGDLPDPNRRIWCADLFFSDAITWAGDCVLCCCNYFAREQISLGNVHACSPPEFSAKKAAIMADRPLPPMCRVCRLPRRSRGERLARAWLADLSAADRAMLTEY